MSSLDQDAMVGAVVLSGGVEGRFLTDAAARALGALQTLRHPAD
jgi:hypothetical protein